MLSMAGTPPSLNLTEVQHVLRDNAANKAAGRALLAQLPPQRRMAARLRSAVAILVIYSTFWVSAYAAAVLTALWWLISRFLGNGSGSSSSPGIPQGTAAGAAAAAALPMQQLPPTTTAGGVSARTGADTANNTMLTPQPAGEAASKTAIVTGGKMTKALHMARHLHAAGWRVVLVETHKYWHVGARLSAAVDEFRTVPIPEEEPEQYFRAIAGLAKQYRAGLFVAVSSPIASVYDALAAELLPPYCRALTLSPQLTALLDNKARFSDYCNSIGLRVPEHFTVSSPEELRALNTPQALGQGAKRFVLKNLAYDSVHRADLFTLPCPAAHLEAYLARPDVIISHQQPWIVQEFIQGKEYSCYTLAHEGRIVAHADTAASLSNLNYACQHHGGIWDWVHTFVTRSGVSGQLCFDFLEAADGALYCIECNPRTSSVVTEFHDHPTFCQALVAPDTVSAPLKPLPTSRPTYWWWNEVARLATSGDVGTFFKTVLCGTDAVFVPWDPLPFLGLHYLQLPMLLLGNMWRGNPWTKVDLCIGKIAELYGD